MEKENKEVNVLDELSKGACMGLDATKMIMDKTDDDGLKKLLKEQYKDYNTIKSKIDDIYPNYSDKEPHETNAINKAMTWYGIEMRTIVDSTTSKLAELLMQGTNMGIIEGRRLLNRKDYDKKIHDLVSEYVQMQEKAVEDLKKFL